MALVITKHAAMRMAQRGIPERDAELIAIVGTEVDSGILVLSKDVQEWVHFLKRLIDRITRLEGKLLIVAQGTVVKTAFHTTRRQQRKRMRRANASDRRFCPSAFEGRHAAETTATVGRSALQAIYAQKHDGG